MTHYASKCAHCTDSTKKCVRTRLKDENGSVFYEQMYECGNFSCEVNRGISHIQKKLPGTNEKNKKGARKYEESNYHRTRTGERRTNNRKDGCKPSGDSLL